MARRGITFDAVFVSHMRRARQTCQLVVEAASPGCTLPHVIDHRLAEKSSGIFAGRSMNLLRMVFGVRGFDRVTASAHTQPPAAEPMAELFVRVSQFYEECVTPLLQQGKNVLIVAHQHPLEALALYLSGQSASVYDGHLDLPNAKALSAAQAIKHVREHHAGFARNVKLVCDQTTVHGVEYAVVAALFGIILKLAIGIKMPDACFDTLLTVALATSSFYAYLDINVTSSFRTVSKPALAAFMVTYLLRLALCIPLASRAVTHQQFLWLVLLIVPPALTSPVTTTLWGGNKYLAVVSSAVCYLSIPAVLAVLPYAPGYLYDNKAMKLFYIVLGAGLIFPAACAQAWRKRSPVEAAKHRKMWSFLSVWGVIALAFIALYQMTPARRNASLIGNLFYPFEHPTESLECARSYWQGCAVFVAMKLGAAGISALLVSLCGLSVDEGMDAYVMHATPNIFLWLGLASSITAVSVEYVKFWGVLFFFTWPALEQVFIVRNFTGQLMKQATESSHISLNEMDSIWQILVAAGVTQMKNGQEVLDEEGVSYFLSYVQQLTTGVREDMPDYMAAAMLQLLDVDRSGYVDKGELFTYVASVGLVIDLNGQLRSRALQPVTRSATVRIKRPSTVTNETKRLADAAVERLLSGKIARHSTNLLHHGDLSRIQSIPRASDGAVAVDAPAASDDAVAAPVDAWRVDVPVGSADAESLSPLRSRLLVAEAEPTASGQESA